MKYFLSVEEIFCIHFKEKSIISIANISISSPHCQLPQGVNRLLFQPAYDAHISPDYFASNPTEVSGTK